MVRELHTIFPRTY